MHGGIGRRALACPRGPRREVKTVPRIITDFSRINERDWDQLDHGDNPFLSYAFLKALESSASISADTGWQPHHLGSSRGEQLLAFAPTYIKSHSHGEFVFDWAWAAAYQRHSLPYYPKLLTAIPYSPVTGPRLLVRKGQSDAGALKQALLKLAIDECRTRSFSSWHCNFCNETDAATLDNELLLARGDWQYHWFNQDYRCFDNFLSNCAPENEKTFGVNADNLLHRVFVSSGSAVKNFQTRTMNSYTGVTKHFHGLRKSRRAEHRVFPRYREKYGGSCARFTGATG